MVAVVVLALVAIAYVYYVVIGTSRNRLMRCPETGAVAFVGAEEVSRRDAAAPRVVVRSCEFWPARKDCAQGCLVITSYSIHYTKLYEQMRKAVAGRR